MYICNVSKSRPIPIRKSQIDSVATLGFSWKHSNRINPVLFLRRNFNGIRPLSLSRHAKRLLSPLAITPMEGEWLLSEPPPSLSFLYISKDGFNTKTGVAFSRRFERTSKGIEVYHEYLSLPEQFRGQGIGKQVLKEWFNQYERMSVKKIKVHATLLDGGYTWARAGFKAVNKAEVDRILVRAKMQLSEDNYNDAKGFYDDHYNNFKTSPFPIEIWSRLDFMEKILRGSSWHGEIDLTDQIEFANFKEYVSRT